MDNRTFIYLIDLPTFPKGILSLSFAAISANVPPKYKINFVDLNLDEFNSKQRKDLASSSCLFVGLKVSPQNYNYAVQITIEMKAQNPQLKVVWGGEFPTLMPDRALVYADIVVMGSFENISSALFNDFENNRLNEKYDGRNNYQCSSIPLPDYTIIDNQSLYFKSMGIPMETSRGCDKKCTFCMVHTMQPLSNYKTLGQLKNELIPLKGKFINVIDYNIGVDRNHLNNIIQSFAESEIDGWMGEICLESLDDDEILEGLANSRCRILYCGLESVSEVSLKSINKAKTNNIANYRRIINKVQSYGIQIAAGIIIGMEDSSKKTIDETFQFYQEVGLIYAKITFLTYNPGTKVHESMKRVGEYLTEDVQFYDGNHFSFLPHRVNREEVTEALKENIRTFYQLKCIHERAKTAKLSGLAYWEFIYFTICYRDAYLKWLEYGIFESEEEFKRLLDQRFVKSPFIEFADNEISRIRALRSSSI